MERRVVRFTSYDDLLRDAEALAGFDYDRAGNWDLAQICNHLATVMEMSLDGFPARYPWFVRLVARWFFLGKMLRHQVSRKRFPAPAYMQPPDSHDDRAAVERLRTAVKRLNDHTGSLQPSPIFGKLTPEQWCEVHLWHGEHHLSFLQAKATAESLT
jgi:Protein of unknown function (DUF1569)